MRSRIGLMREEKNFKSSRKTCESAVKCCHVWKVEGVEKRQTGRWSEVGEKLSSPTCAKGRMCTRNLVGRHYGRHDQRDRIGREHVLAPSI
jgi:hypothetical protein